MPFDQFTIEQLAGDLLPEPTREQRIATGFHRNHHDQRRGRDRPRGVPRRVRRRPRRTPRRTVWLGLTIGCAQCHDHKYRPDHARRSTTASSPSSTASPRNGRRPRQRPAGSLHLTTPDAGGPARRQHRARSSTPLRSARDRAGRRPGRRPVPGGVTTAALTGPARQRRGRRVLQGATTMMVMQRAGRSRARRSSSIRGAVRQARRARSCPGVPAACPPLPAGAPPNRLGLARWLVDPAQPADGPRGGQPLLAAALRHRPGRRPPRTSASQGEPPTPPRAARLAGRRVRRTRLGRQGAASG